MNDSRIDSSTAAGLAPAGAGLSKGRALFLRHIGFPLLKRVISFERALARFEKEGWRIVALCNRLDEARLFERVLVPPLFGLEENSRFYSVAMTVAHLHTVGLALERRIPALSRGERFAQEVRIEDFKPYREIPADVVEQYARFIENFRKNLTQNLGDIYLNNRYEHPWFGPLNPKEWMVMGMIHQIVHRRQIEAILKLNAGGEG